MSTWKKVLVVLCVVLGIAGLVVGFAAHPWWTLLIVAFAVVWRYWLSVKVVNKDEVAIPLKLGDPIIAHEVRDSKGNVTQFAQICTSGQVYVPWIPIKWDRHYPWELVRIPRRQLPFNFKRLGKEEEQRIWSKDGVLLLADISGYVRFPYEEGDSLLLMIRSGVPLDEEGLQTWMRDEIVSGMRDILAGYTHEEVIQRSKLDEIRAKAQEFLLKKTGLFARSGICGNDATNFETGTGEVIIRVDTISPTETLREAMESKVVNMHLAIAAKQTAEIEKTLAGDPILHAMDDWVKSQKGDGETVADAKARLITSGAYAKHELIVKDIILAKSGNLQVSQTLLGSPDGTPLPASLTYLSVGGGGGAGILFSGKGGGNPGGNPRGQGGGQQGQGQQGGQLAGQPSPSYVARQKKGKQGP